MSLFAGLNDAVGHEFSGDAIESIKDIVNRYPVTVVQVAATFTEDEVKKIGEAIKAVNDNTADAQKKAKALNVLGWFIGKLPVAAGAL